MTNEELVRRYYGGDERALEELYRRNLGLIRRIARETAREFNCLHMDRERPGELSGYTKTILEDLCGEGALEFLTRVQSREYDESRAVLATYLYPHLKGRMTRWLEQHIGNLSLSKHEMDAVRQAQRLYHSGQFSIEEIAEKTDVLLEQAVKHIRYNTHFVGVNDLIPPPVHSMPFFSAAGRKQGRVQESPRIFHSHVCAPSPLHRTGPGSGKATGTGRNAH